MEGIFKIINKTRMCLRLEGLFFPFVPAKCVCFLSNCERECYNLKRRYVVCVFEAHVGKNLSPSQFFVLILVVMITVLLIYKIGSFYWSFAWGKLFNFT